MVSAGCAEAAATPNDTAKRAKDDFMRNGWLRRNGFDATDTPAASFLGNFFAPLAPFCGHCPFVFSTFMDFVLDPTSAPHGIPPIDFRGQLNDEQFAAVTAEPGPLLVLAGAGSAKPPTLTSRVASLLWKAVLPGEFLLFTFTTKPAKKMLN